MYSTSEHQKQLTVIYGNIYKKRLEEARTIRKQMAHICRQNYTIPLHGILFGTLPIVIVIIAVLFLN